VSEHNQHSRQIPLEGGINFRDLGGYRTDHGKTVKWRRLMRCGHLAKLTDNDLKLLKSYEVDRVHDFRRTEEQKQSPSQPIAAKFIDDYQISIGDISRFWEFLQDGILTDQASHELVVNSYRHCVQSVIPAYSRFMRELVDSPKGAHVFHCSAGKDRTGMAAALILGALRVPRKTIVSDYLLTLEYYNSDKLMDIIEGHLRDAGVETWERSWLIPYSSVHADNIIAFLNAIDEGYGSLKNYLIQGLGLSINDLEVLQDRYLEG
jgi:protein-tyrosine phosphatase